MKQDIFFYETSLIFMKQIKNKMKQKHLIKLDQLSKISGSTNLFNLSSDSCQPR